MRMEDIVVRRTTPEDAAAVAPLLYSSAPELFDWLFLRSGRDAIHYLEYSMRRGKSLFSSAVQWVVESDGEIVATGAYYDAATYQKLGWQMVPEVFRLYPVFQALKISRDALSIGKTAPPPASGYIYVANLGVAPAWRSKGLGSVLVKYFETEHRQAGGLGLVLDVAATNPRAEALYHRLGFEFRKQRQFRGTAAATVPAGRRMRWTFADSK